MARIFWFAAGAAAGLAYASQLVNKERLNLPPGVEAPIAPTSEKGPSFKVKMADMIDQRTDQILTLIDERVIALTDKLHAAGHELAASLRGETEQPEVVVIDTITLFTEPVEEPVTANATTSTSSTMGSSTSTLGASTTPNMGTTTSSTIGGTTPSGMGTSTPSTPGPSPRSSSTDTGTSQSDMGFETNR